MDAPIIVTGMGRSGTTWVQHFLSKHRFVKIAGQEPLPLDEFFQWLDSMRHGVDYAERANRQTNYSPPHYAGCDYETCNAVFRNMFRDYFMGDMKYGRWGIKALGLYGHANLVAYFDELWPEARWILCVRDPLDAYRSARETFAPDADLRDWLRHWAKGHAFVRDRDDVFLFQIDKFCTEPPGERVKITDAMLIHIGERHTTSTRNFGAACPDVHRRKQLALTSETVEVCREDIDAAMDGSVKAAMEFFGYVVRD